MNRLIKRLKYLVFGSKYRVLVLRKKGVTFQHDNLFIRARSYEQAERTAYESKGIYDEVQIVRIDLMEL